VTSSNTPILTVDDDGPVVLWNLGTASIDIHFGGPAGVAEDLTLDVGTGVAIQGNQRVDAITTFTNFLQILRGVRPGG
jgi:hypothetical protein